MDKMRFSFSPQITEKIAGRSALVRATRNPEHWGDLRALFLAGVHKPKRLRLIEQASDEDLIRLAQVLADDWRNKQPARESLEYLCACSGPPGVSTSIFCPVCRSRALEEVRADRSTPERTAYLNGWLASSGAVNQEPFGQVDRPEPEPGPLTQTADPNPPTPKAPPPLP